MLVLSGHAGPVVDLTFSPDGQWLASASRDGSVRLWDLHHGAMIRQFTSAMRHACAVAFDAAGHELAIGYAEPHGRVERWAPLGDRPIDVWAAHAHSTRTLAYSPRQPFLATGGDDQFVKLWTISERYPGYRTLSPRRHQPVQALAYSPDGQLLAVVTTRPATVRLYQAERQRLHDGYQFQQSWAHSIAFAPDRSSVACGLDDFVAIWPIKGKRTVPTRFHAHQGAILGVAYRPEGRGYISAGADGLARMWDAEGRCERTYDWQAGELCSLAIAPHGMVAAVGGAESIVLWDLE